MNGLGLGAGAALLGTTILATGVASVWILAKNDQVFTTVREGTAKGIVAGVGDNEEFVGMVMRMQGKCFKWWAENPIERYDVVDIDHTDNPDKEDKRNWLLMVDEERGQPTWLSTLKRTPVLSDFFAGLYYIGLPTYGIKQYTFKWTSVEQKEASSDQDKERSQAVLVTTEKDIDYIYLIEDVYALVVDKADLHDLMEHDIEVVFRARVVNPYKALFVIEKWLEAITVTLSRAFVPFVASLNTREIHALRSGKKAATGTPFKLDEIFGKLRKGFLEDYGVEVWDIGILSSDPTEIVAEEYSKAQIKRVTAQANADATRTQADADAYRIDLEYKAIGKHPHGPRVRDAEAIEASGLTTLATGGAGIALAVPTDENKPRDPNRPRQGRRGQQGGRNRQTGDTQ